MTHDPDPAPEPVEGARRRRVVRRVGAATRRLVEGAEDVAGVVADTAGEALTEAGEAIAETRLVRRVNERRLQRRRRRAPKPLPNLFHVHPEARLAPIREVGLATIPVEEIRGTAVEGADQRGLDFQPLPAFRSANWDARWQRLKAASERLDSLPPIDVLRTPDGYWVTDGHNRVAIALVNRQLDIDADVRAVVLPGQGPVRPAGPLAPVLIDSAGLSSPGRGVDRRRRGAKAREADVSGGGTTPSDPDGSPS